MDQHHGLAAAVPNKVCTPLSSMLAQPASAPALRIGQETWTYGEITERAATLARRLREFDGGPGNLVAILAYRSMSAYLGVIATHFSGRGYVPLHPRFPLARTLDMLIQAGTRTLVVGPEALGPMNEVLDRYPGSLTVIGPELEDFGPATAGDKRHTLLAAPDCRGPGQVVPAPQGGASTAYVMFTSGSTGRPKGVPVTLANLQNYVEYILRKYPLGAGDLASQTFDMTFDLSVHDMFVTWASGACLFSLSQATLAAPAKFIRDAALTIWFSVPSLAMHMQRMRLLRPGIFPSLRLSFFCGEPLPLRTASVWAEACPNSALVNLYGPTETTIAISEYKWDTPRTAAESLHGVVPIGRIFPKHDYRLLESDGHTGSLAGRGELCITGPQVTMGYLNNPAKTAEQFVQFPDAGNALWYRTGDIVETTPSGDLAFVGRVDSQIKINGYRVDLQEVDAVLRAAANTDLAVAVPWPVTEEGVKGIVGCCVENQQIDLRHVVEACQKSLPAYMVPSRIVALPSLPLNANGKIDRLAIRKILDGQRDQNG